MSRGPEFGAGAAALRVAGVPVLAGLLIGFGAQPAAALPSQCSLSGSTETCVFGAGVSSDFASPSGVSMIQVHVVGGRGGSGPNTGPGGLGAVVDGSIGVSPDLTLHVGAGNDGTVSTTAHTGFNAGGSAAGAGTGGDSSFVVATVLGPAGLDSAVFAVAAGGGGGGENGQDAAGNSLAGGAGGDATTAGTDGAGALVAGGGGLPPTGTNSDGGAGGRGGSPNGNDGGAGGSQLVDEPSPGGSGGGVGISAGGPGGGGGGSGWAGGGGGGQGAASTSPAPGPSGGGGGGGGGANLVPPAGSASLDVTGSPEVVLSWTGSAYSFTFTATGESNIGYSSAGTIPPGLSLAADGTLSGTPTAAGTYAFTVTATGDAGGTAEQHESVTVRPAPTPNASVSPATLDFGAENLHSTSQSQGITVSNTGSGAMTISGVSIAGSNTADFAITSDGCSGQTVGAGSSCKVAVSFSPTAAGPRSATLKVADDAPGSPQLVSLSGTGVAVADLGVTLTAAGNVKTGRTLSYALAAKNQGPDSARGVTVSDNLPAGVQFADLAAPAGWSCSHPAVGSSGPVACSTPDLASGTTATFTIDATVVGSGKTSVNDSAGVSASGSTDPTAGDDTATATTNIRGKP